MNSNDVSTALICKNILGESCFWDPRINSLIWTDIEGKKIWKLNEKNQSMIGKTLKVVIDDVGEKHSVGRTEYDSPEIDNIVNINQALKIGQFYNIKIESANEFELIGSPSK